MTLPDKLGIQVEISLEKCNQVPEYCHHASASSGLTKPKYNARCICNPI